MKTEIQAFERAAQQPGNARASRQKIHFEFKNPSANKVCVAGTFNDWKPEAGEMVRMDGGKFTRDLAISPGTYEYRLVVDGKWMPDPHADHSVMNPFGEKNSLLTVA